MNTDSASLFDLSGRVAVVTGSGRGLGKVMAGGLAAAGAGVLICSRTGSEAEATAAEITAAGGPAGASPVPPAPRPTRERRTDLALSAHGPPLGRPHNPRSDILQP